MEHELDQSPHRTRTLAPAITTLAGVATVFERIRRRLEASIIGRDEVIDLLMIALLADGHVLLEDYPGSGKTTLAKALGDCLVDDQPENHIVSLRRIQFTPDMLPSDITGTTIFDPNTNRFFFRPGPVFAYIVLADEINRTSPKVQSALLEAMAEKQCTIDNKTRKLDELFFVIATQNPLDLAGTYPLPSPQLDRFLFKIRMNHISRDAEIKVLETLKSRKKGPPESLERVTRTEVLDARKVIEEQVYCAPLLQEALVDIAQETRRSEKIVQGLSTRSLVLALPALQARALLYGRTYVNGSDLEALAPVLFAHRLTLAPGTESAEEALEECCQFSFERLAKKTMELKR